MSVEYVTSSINLKAPYLCSKFYNNYINVGTFTLIMKIMNVSLFKKGEKKILQI